MSVDTSLTDEQLLLLAQQLVPGMHRTAGLTRSQMMDWRKRLIDTAGMQDTSKVVHEWDNGWHITEPQTYGDMEREGQLMGNCFSFMREPGVAKEIWQSHPSVGALEHPGYTGPDSAALEDTANDFDGFDPRYNDSKESPWQHPIPGHAADNYYVLRDEWNLPHAAIDMSHVLGGDEGILGKHNSELKPKYQPMVNEFLKAQNDEFGDTIDPSYFRTAGAQRPSNSGSGIGNKAKADQHQDHIAEEEDGETFVWHEDHEEAKQANGNGEASSNEHDSSIQASTSSVMYHVGWEEDEPSVQEHGLRPTNAWGTGNEFGLYLFESEADAREWADERDPGHHPIYAVDTSGVELRPDPLIKGAWITNQTLPVSKRIAHAPRVSEYEEWQPCPGCGTLISPSADYCFNCRNGLSDATREASIITGVGAGGEKVTQTPKPVSEQYMSNPASKPKPRNDEPKPAHARREGNTAHALSAPRPRPLPYARIRSLYSKLKALVSVSDDIQIDRTDFSALPSWQPGQHGKALIYPSGTITSWNVDEYGSPHHQEMMTGGDYDESIGIEIQPDGQYDSWSALPPEAHTALQQHHPQLHHSTDDWEWTHTSTQHTASSTVTSTPPRNPEDLNNEAHLEKGLVPHFENPRPRIVSRFGASEPLFHVSPPENRERIKTWGLQPGKPDVDYGGNYELPFQAQGVYLFPQSAWAEEWENAESHQGIWGPTGHGDVWEVDPSFISESHEDSILPGAIRVPHPIPGEALSLRTDLGRYWPRSEDDKQKFNSPPWKHDEYVQRGEEALNPISSSRPKTIRSNRDPRWIKTADYGRREHWNPGDKAFFEYQCYQGHDSCDANLWYRSHQPVTVLGIEPDQEEVNLQEPWAAPSMDERGEIGLPKYYRIRFPDGLEHTCWESELVESPSHLDPEGAPPPVEGVPEANRHLYPTSSCRPEMKMGSDLVRVYHGTHAGLGDQIAEEGLAPRDPEGWVINDEPTTHDYSYVTTDPKRAEYYARAHAAKAFGDGEIDKPQGAVLSWDVHPDMLEDDPYSPEGEPDQHIIYGGLSDLPVASHDVLDFPELNDPSKLLQWQAIHSGIDKWASTSNARGDPNWKFAAAPLKHVHVGRGGPEDMEYAVIYDPDSRAVFTGIFHMTIQSQYPQTSRGIKGIVSGGDLSWYDKKPSPQEVKAIADTLGLDVPDWKFGSSLQPWEPGKQGKGIALPDNSVITWQTSARGPHHEEIEPNAYQKGYVPFDIAPNGDFAEYNGKMSIEQLRGLHEKHPEMIRPEDAWHFASHDWEWGLSEPKVTIHEPQGFNLSDNPNGRRIPFIYDHHPQDENDVHVYMGHPGAEHADIGTTHQFYGDRPGMYSEEEMPEWVGWHGTGAIKPEGYRTDGSPAGVEFYGGPRSFNEYDDPDPEDEPNRYQIPATAVNNALVDHYRGTFNLPQWEKFGAWQPGGEPHASEEYTTPEGLERPKLDEPWKGLRLHDGRTFAWAIGGNEFPFLYDDGKPWHQHVIDDLGIDKMDVGDFLVGKAWDGTPYPEHDWHFGSAIRVVNVPTEEVNHGAGHAFTYDPKGIVYLGGPGSFHNELPLAEDGNLQGRVDPDNIAFYGYNWLGDWTPQMKADVTQALREQDLFATDGGVFGWGGFKGDEQQDWKFGSNELTFEDAHAFSGEEEMWPTHQQPVLYLPKENHVIIGSPGTHHFDYFPKGVNRGDDTAFAQAPFHAGTFWPADEGDGAPVFEWNSFGGWGPHDVKPPLEVTRAIENHLGVPEAHSWHFGSEPVNVWKAPDHNPEGAYPILWHGKSNTLYVGGENITSNHKGLAGEAELPPDPYGYHAAEGVMHGWVGPSQNQVHWYEPPPTANNEIHKALGLQTFDKFGVRIAANGIQVIEYDKVPTNPENFAIQGLGGRRPFIYNNGLIHLGPPGIYHDTLRRAVIDKGHDGYGTHDTKFDGYVMHNGEIDAWDTQHPHWPAAKEALEEHLNVKPFKFGSEDRWEPGAEGRGLLWPSGVVDTWNSSHENGPTHFDYYPVMTTAGDPREGDPKHLWIDPDGLVNDLVSYGDEQAKPLNEEERAAIKAHHPKLDVPNWKFGSEPAIHYHGEGPHAPIIFLEDENEIHVGEPGWGFFEDEGIHKASYIDWDGWTPGMWGKGLIYDGEAYAWPLRDIARKDVYMQDGDDRMTMEVGPHHGEALMEINPDFDEFEDDHTPLNIRPDGTVEVAGYADGELTDQEMALLKQKFPQMTRASENWKFGGMGGWNVVEGRKTFGDFPSNIDAVENDFPDLETEWRWRRPFLVDERSKNIYLGQPGVHHDNLEEEFNLGLYGGDESEDQYRSYAQGYAVADPSQPPPEGKLVTMYNDNSEGQWDDAIEDVREHLGYPAEQEFKFGSERAYWNERPVIYHPEHGLHEGEFEDHHADVEERMGFERESLDDRGGFAFGWTAEHPVTKEKTLDWYHNISAMPDEETIASIADELNARPLNSAWRFGANLPQVIWHGPEDDGRYMQGDHSFIYQPMENQLHIGTPLYHHDDIWQSMGNTEFIYSDDLSAAEDEGKAIIGSVYEDHTNMDTQVPPETQATINGALGLPVWGKFGGQYDFYDNREPSYEGKEYVEWMDPKELWPYREYDRDLDRHDDFLEHVQEHGLKEDVKLEYHPDTGMVHIGEGNHRVKHALEQGWPALPVTVLRTQRIPEGLPGQKAPTYIEPDRYGYVPGVIKPSQIGLPVVPAPQGDIGKLGAAPPEVVYLGDKDAPEAANMSLPPVERYPIIHAPAENKLYVGAYGQHHIHTYEQMGMSDNLSPYYYRFEGRPKSHQLGTFSPSSGFDWFHRPPGMKTPDKATERLEAALRDRMGWNEQEDWKF